MEKSEDDADRCGEGTTRRREQLEKCQPRHFLTPATLSLHPSTSPSSTTRRRRARRPSLPSSQFILAVKMKYTISFILLCLSAVLVRAQTQTLVDAAGQTIVEVITLDPVQGLPTTQTLQTLQGGAAQQTTTTTQPLNQGPVGQPAATTALVTTYVYTTTDALGDPTVILDTFTPTSVTGTVTPSQTFTGTILNYSSWLNIVGTNTVAADTASSATRLLPLLRNSYACAAGAALLSGTLGGAWLVFA
ncbi:uncharacterized protein FOMMEDRAFT_165709 [Fomitiporia mediterranea MF3/22]|uniref:uncharacterized protein n=1 Tax=Fomitiporia mediterranea (strain MF3/22) TaxID=694068 RepID=UPI0004408E38|nr:uncharacterized protein FOMMEDRAFT_165709 [Fomitiporia mediterranea MF3/22]EJD07092.1 hypothetical protein FOMMEDRAFT_165709 [Fomitiporia mediterranea MF3/22]